MTRQNNPLERMRIASPCSVGWERMSGTERVRFCDLCDLHVYNISEMTATEVESLLAQTEGRLCARLYRRADGTVLTKDCPVGLRAARKRIAKMAGAALTVILSLCSGVVGQTKSQDDKNCKRIPALKIKKAAAKGETKTFTGVVLDEIGAVIPGANITLTDEQTKKKYAAISSDEGEWGFSDLPAGGYTLEIEVTGFETYKHEHLLVSANEILRVEATLPLMTGNVTVGIIIEDTTDVEPENGARTFKTDTLQKLPLP